MQKYIYIKPNNLQHARKFIILGIDFTCGILMKEMADRRDAATVTAQQQGMPLHSPDRSLGLALEALSAPPILLKPQ